MTDGAHQGVGAARALDTIIGGASSPSEDEQRTPEQLEEYLRRNTEFDGTGRGGYEACANSIAVAVIDLIRSHPDIDWTNVPGSDVMDYSTSLWELIRKGVDGHWKEIDPAGYKHLVSDAGITGFQWGWAINAARYCCGLGPVANPALMTISIHEEDQP